MPTPAEVPASQRPPTLLALHSYLAGNVGRVGHRALVALLKEHRLVLAQYSILVALSDFGELAPHELAKRLQIDRSHVSSYIESLLKRGWVERTPDACDRRRVAVSLTDEGRERVTELKAAAVESQQTLLAALTEDEQRTLRTLLLKVLAADESSDGLC